MSMQRFRHNHITRSLISITSRSASNRYEGEGRQLQMFTYSQMQVRTGCSIELTAGLAEAHAA
jgi:hypothetical protein